MTTAQERKQQERQARRRRIQRAARSVFAEKGYAKTSIEQVAREASLSVGAIYLYFRSKEDLYVSLLEETLEQFDQELGAIAASEGSAAMRLTKAWDRLNEWATNDVEATRVLRLTAQPNVKKQLSDEVSAAVGQGVSTLQGHLRTIVSGGQGAGEFSGSDASASVDLLWSLFLGVLQANDIRMNLEIGGGDLASLSNVAFRAALGQLGASVSAQAAA